MNEKHHGSMELPLVVGVDGSEPSLRAVDWAADEAALRGVPLRLVHASLWERYAGAAPAEDLGEPSEQLLADGSWGPGGAAVSPSLLLGSVSLAVAAYAACPVIVLRGRHDKRVQPVTRGRILLGVGEEAYGAGALRLRGGGAT